MQQPDTLLSRLYECRRGIGGAAERGHGTFQDELKINFK
jgi:hypothetical protein